MDQNFFEFWGQLFLNVAKGQKQLEEMNSFLRKGLDGYESMTALFRDSYGLDKTANFIPDHAELWEKATGNYQASFRQLLSFWGAVPKGDQEALISKCEGLEKKVTEQEQTIRHLRSLLGERQDDASSVTKELQGLLTKQQKEFEALVNAMGFLFEEKKKSPDAKKH